MRTKILVLLAALLFTHAAHAEAVVGQPVPALVTPTLDGKAFDLSSLKGKVVVLHFWATWCPACRDEMPALEAVWRKTHSKGVEVLAISADRPRNKSDVLNLMHYFTFPASMMDSASKNDFGTPSAIPVTYVIGKDGVVVDMMRPDIKPLTEGGLGGEVKALLEAKTDAPKPETKPDEKTDAKP